MTSTTLDCVTCGACCFSTNPRYLALLPEDSARTLPAGAVLEENGRRYVRFEDGRCVLLRRTEDARLVCSAYEQRPEACRAFRAGSFECHKTRRANGVAGDRVDRTRCVPADGGA